MDATRVKVGTKVKFSPTLRETVRTGCIGVIDALPDQDDCSHWCTLNVKYKGYTHIAFSLHEVKILKY